MGRPWRASILLTASIAVLGSCASTRIVAAPAAAPICAPGVDLGHVAVALTTRWRADQKEPEDRERLAREAIAEVFAALRCGQFTGFDAAAQARAQTQIAVELREFGPKLVLSLPILWSGWADLDYSFTVTDRRSGSVGSRADEHREVGGPFTVQGMAGVSHAFRQSLLDRLYGKAEPRL